MGCLSSIKDLFWSGVSPLSILFDHLINLDFGDGQYLLGFAFWIDYLDKPSIGDGQYLLGFAFWIDYLDKPSTGKVIKLCLLFIQIFKLCCTVCPSN